MDWTKEEVALIVADYFSMLLLELKGEKYNKTEHRKALLPLLEDHRKGPAIEFKHQNISAVLSRMGYPFIKGYKPRYNYQQLLEEETIAYIKAHKMLLEQYFELFSNKVVGTQVKQPINFDDFLSKEPVYNQVAEHTPSFTPIKTNYLEKEQKNRSLGESGESLIMEYERWRLIKEGKETLADKIKWMSKERGDGMGYDILSRNTNGTDRFIEVKTTKLPKETPIFLTTNEIAFATLKQHNFYLYRVFNFGKSPRVFIRNGQYETFCDLVPHTFKGYFKQ